MHTSPRRDDSTVARQPADSNSPPADGPRLFVKVSSDTVAERAALAQKELRDRVARIRRDARRYTDFVLAVDAKSAGALFDLSERAWRRLDVTGQVPAPIRVGRSVRWRLKELAAWVRAGCPDREAWEAR
jgi:hypothetical protein